MLFITEETDIIFNRELQVIYFYLQRMPFHQYLIQTIEKIEEKNKKIAFMAVDAADFTIFCKRHQVKSVPTFILFQRGDQIKKMATLDINAFLSDII